MWWSWSRHRAHPRACGENVRVFTVMVVLPGSSPRVRGKLPATMFAVFCEGLIPARAGKTCDVVRTHEALGAHPRACGENRRVGAASQDGNGSSPRVRGKPHRRNRLLVRGGLIPARAGKTEHRPRDAHPPRAHPRACGENRTAQARRSAHPGSSPRVRGKHAVVRVVGVHDGLIPARAGKT